MTISKEWHARAQVEYFSAFLKLWLSFNSYYKNHLISGLPRNSPDREFIERIKTTDNVLKNKFKSLYEGDFDDSKEFKLYLIELIKKYDGGRLGGLTIRGDDLTISMNGAHLNEISFKDFIHPLSLDLKRRPPHYIKVNKVYIKENPDDIFPYFIEIIYALRNMLVHGSMAPSEDNHKIISHVYDTLNFLIKDLIP